MRLWFVCDTRRYYKRFLTDWLTDWMNDRTKQNAGGRRAVFRWPEANKAKLWNAARDSGRERASSELLVRRNARHVTTASACRQRSLSTVLQGRQEKVYRPADMIQSLRTFAADSQRHRPHWLIHDDSNSRQTSQTARQTCRWPSAAVC